MPTTTHIADSDLAALSLPELKTLQKKVDKAVATYEDRQKKQALSELEAKAKEMGFTLAELTGAKSGKIKTAGVAKYQNPDNPDQTWTGKGRRPAWFIAALEAGKSPEDLAL